MLILTRRLDEVIRMNDDITIQVLSVNSERVRLGISAPAAVSVWREEIYQAIQQREDKEDGESAAV